MACLALVCAAPPHRAEVSDETWRRESRQWLETLSPGAAVRVLNPLGSVHARFGGYAGQVEVLATLQYDAAQALRPEVSVTAEDAGLAVEAHGAGSGPSVRADLVVFVPAGVTLNVETTHDAIDAKGLKGDLNASSVAGDITIRAVRGRVRAKTARGTLSATLETGATDRSQAFSTETGEIEIYLWEDAEQRVLVATSGEIGTDFSIDIEHFPGEEPGKRAVAVVGGGGPEISLTSKRGRIRLLRLPRGLGR